MQGKEKGRSDETVPFLSSSRKESPKNSPLGPFFGTLYKEIRLTRPKKAATIESRCKNHSSEKGNWTFMARKKTKAYDN
jgi:hypothetical protein